MSRGRSGGIADVGETVVLADGLGEYARVTVMDVRRQPPGSMDNAPQAVPFAERFLGGSVAVYAVHVRIEPTRDLPDFGGTGGWIMLCPGKRECQSGLRGRSLSAWMGRICRQRLKAIGQARPTKDGS